MDVFLFSIFFFIAVILLLLTFFKKQIIIGIFSGIFFILCGVLLWSGISYVSSTTIVGAPGNYTVINHYSEWSNEIVLGGGFYDNQIIGSAFVLLGLFLLVVCGVMVFSEKKSVDFLDDDSSDSEGE